MEKAPKRARERGEKVSSIGKIKGWKSWGECLNKWVVCVSALCVWVCVEETGEGMLCFLLPRVSQAVSEIR